MWTNSKFLTPNKINACYAKSNRSNSNFFTNHHFLPNKGSEQPDSSSVETLLYHLDSSGGLLPRPMRGEMLRPVWQFHGAENPLADRDQSCFVCCALGEAAFMGTFSCSTYLLQSIDVSIDSNICAFT